MIRIVGSKAVGVNGMRAVVHQLVDPASVTGLKLAVAGCAAGQLHYLASTVGHIDLELFGCGVGEEHDLWG